MRATKQLLAAAVIAAAVLMPGPADATNSWGGYHWARTSNPVHLDVGNNMSSAWTTHLSTAVDDWNTPPTVSCTDCGPVLAPAKVLDLTLVAGQSTGRCKPTAGRIEVCNASYGNTGWLGVASISVSGTHITAGTAKMNDTYFASPPYNTAAWRQMVVCQEIGHDFGLDHQDENFGNPNLDTCMDYTSDPSTNQHPNQHDYDELAIIYGDHLDTSGGGGGGGGGGGACPPKKPGCSNGAADQTSESDSPADWGQQVRAGKHTSVYERDLGHGARVITFVIWAR